MEDRVRDIYAEFDARRKKADALAADEEDMRMLDDLEKQVKNKKN